LQTLAAECERHGVQALAIPTDVRDEQAVQNLARATYERFGHIDVWINNAGVGAYGFLEDIPSDVFRQIIETNFFGEVYGTRVVLPYFKKQGHGTIINTSSLLGTIPGPYYSAYTASKYAIRGFSAAVRQEVEALGNNGDIHICTVFPATIDTPFFQHAANYSGRAVKALPPVYDVDMVANTMLRLAEKPKRETFVGSSGRTQSLMYAFMPKVAERVAALEIDKGHFKPEPAASSPGTLFSPMPEGTDATGGWHGKGKTQTRRAASLSLAALAPALLFGVWFWRRQKNGS
jgi:short-subunit dehydrogenase